MSDRETYPITVEGVQRELEKFEVAPGVTIAILNILGDVELVQAASRGLKKKLEPYNGQVLITAEAKSIPLIYQLAVDMQLPYIVLRKNYKSYMGDAIQAQTVSITTGNEQTLWLDEKDKALLENKNVIVVDDVVSTGSTLEGMTSIIDQTKAKVVAQAAIFTEGDNDKWEDIVALGHLPVWLDKD